jgi:hypothetical protein
MGIRFNFVLKRSMGWPRTGWFSHILKHIMKTEKRGVIARRLLFLQQSVMLLIRVGWIHKKNADICNNECWNSGTVNPDQCAVVSRVTFTHIEVALIMSLSLWFALRKSKWQIYCPSFSLLTPILNKRVLWMPNLYVYWNMFLLLPSHCRLVWNIHFFAISIAIFDMICFF